MGFPFEASPTGGSEQPPTTALVSLDPDGKLLFADDAFEALTGLDSQTVTGSAFTDHLEEGDGEQFRAALAEVSGDDTLRCRLTIETATGSTVPVTAHGQTETDATGGISRVHCRLAPRSDGAGGFRTFQERNVLLRTLFDGLPMGILAETAERRVLAANEALLSLFDFDGQVAEVMGTDCVELAASVSDQFADPSGFRDGIEARIEAGENTYGERLEMADGKILARHYFPIDLPSGAGHLWVYEDVTDTERRRSELETYERLFEVAPVGVFRTTTDGRVLSVNRKLAEILGYEDVQTLIEDYTDLERDLYADPDRRATFLDRLHRHGVVENFEYEATTRTGGRRWLSMNARLLEETDESARVITGFAWDVTERKQHERQLAVLGRVLRHNLRNAMTVIQGQTELLATGEADSPESAVAAITDRVETLLQQADKERLIVELLRGQATTQTVDLVAMIETVSDDVREEYPQATVDTECQASQTTRVCVGFERAIEELIDNAIRHSDEESPTVSITVSTGPDGIDIRVADTGPGIPEVERRLLTGETDESPLYHGVGVGLVLVRQLVHSSGGTVSIGSNEPRGNVVTIHLPATTD